MRIKTALTNSSPLVHLCGTTAQSQIQRTLNAAIPRIAEILSQEQFRSRHALGRRLCAEFQFVDHHGRKQLAGCLKVLRVLEALGVIVLPPAQEVSVHAGPSLRSAPVSAAENVPGQVAEIVGLEIEEVTTRGQRRIWNTLLAREHPHGVTTFAGHQIRYLVRSRAWVSGRGRVFGCGTAPCRAGALGGLDGRPAPGASGAGGVPEPVPDPSRSAPVQTWRRMCWAGSCRRLPGDFEARYWFPAVACRDLSRSAV